MMVELIVYFSSVSNNTHRFVERLGIKRERIPLYPKDEPLQINEPYVLITPTYGGGEGKGAVPKQVIKFLNNEKNRSLLKGVVSCGNTNFGPAYCLAGDIIAQKCQVPHLHRVEILGTAEDVTLVKERLKNL